MNKSRVLIVDDHKVVRAGIAAMLGDFEWLEIVGEARDGDEAIELALQLKPDIVLTDQGMPGMSGIEVTRRLHEVLPDARVVLLSAFTSRSVVRGALDAGAYGYVAKDSPPETLGMILQSVARGDRAIDPRLLDAVLQGEDGLSKREYEVLGLLAKGLMNEAIAQELGISRETVKVHVSAILRKLNATSRTEAVLNAVREDIVDIRM